MNFDLSEEQQILVDTVAKFVKDDSPVERFRKLRETAFQNPSSYFRKYTQVSEEEAMDYARGLWRTINKPNLVENIAPTRGRATLVLRKGPDHTVQRLRLRKL